MTIQPLDHDHTSLSGVAPSLLRRAGILCYGVLTYGVGVVALIGLILVSLGVLPFTGGPVRIQSPVLAGTFNGGLLVVFALQHSLMAREWFKKRWTRIIDSSMERSTYLLATAVALLPLLLLWQPLPVRLWSIASPGPRLAVTGIGLAGWVYLFLASFAINHFELFGLQQVWQAFRGKEASPVKFRERWMYRFDRHPIMTGVIIGLWATPDMTWGRLLFNAGFSLYVAVGVYFEERALRRQWGETYEAYRRRVPSIVPVFSGS
jgi:protein-S-isoprenylcysteine O-methyltransferase Ste14